MLLQLSLNSQRQSRGTCENPANRFEPIRLEPGAGDWDPEENPTIQTQYLKDHSASLITYNDSPDVGFRAGINPYRGCEHGCIYCYARPTHEFLGFSSGLDFESVILVKQQAPNILRRELSAKSWQPQALAMSGVTDPYQPVERRLRITRGCLKVLADFRNPVGVITKNELVTRDIDLLQRLADFSAVVVFVSLTTLDRELRKVMEPRTSPPEARLRAIETLASNGIPVGAMLAPIVPGLTDHEIPKLLSKAAQAGAQHAGYVILRLPYQVKDLFVNWLKRHFPDREQKVLRRLRTIRKGKLNHSAFHNRMKGDGIFADQIRQMFQVASRKVGLNRRSPKLSTAHFRRQTNQLDMFCS